LTNATSPFSEHDTWYSVPDPFVLRVRVPVKVISDVENPTDQTSVTSPTPLEKTIELSVGSQHPGLGTLGAGVRDTPFVFRPA
jgi:hypothetical protein